jgi:hypothetical protein
MEAACWKVISWLEKSGYVPENAVEEIERLHENLEDSINDFMRGAVRLHETDYHNPRVFAERVAEMGVKAQDLRNDIQDIEDALRKTLVALPESVFAHELPTEHRPED